MSSRLFPIFSSVRFIISGFMLISLIHWELSFKQNGKYRSIWILLQAVFIIDHHDLLKVLPFYKCVIPASLSKIRCPQFCGFFCIFNPKSSASVSLLVPKPYYLFYYSFLVQLEIGDDDTSGSSFIIQDGYSYSVILHVSI